MRRAPPRKRRRRLRWLFAALALAALALFLFWPDAETPAPVEPPTASALAAVPVKQTRLTTPPPRHPPPREGPEREALLAAVRERASSLRDCAAGALTRLPLRLHVARTGAMRSVDITGDAPPPAVASCVRKKAMTWKFDQIRLLSDVELLVAISFAPGA
ncbi:MAG: hypothetical protein ABR567_10340 [Myxococcales bacterium]|nr:hypothetical protein [Myxococcales bacterium]